MSIFRFQRIERFYRRLFLSISILLILIGALSLDLKKAPFSSFQNPVLYVAYLLESAGKNFIQGISKIWFNYINLVQVHERYNQLSREIEILKSENIQLKESQAENQRLHKLLDISLPAPLKLIAAQVIMREPSNWYQSLTINRGSDAGILPGMGVITPYGIVGRVLKVGPKSAIVLLITDRNSAVPALISRTRDEGILEGTTHGFARIKYLSPDLKLKIGDQVLTSGLTPTFPKGLLIGNIIKTDEKIASSSDPFLSVEVVPAVNFSRLEEVMVIASSQAEK